MMNEMVTDVMAAEMTFEVEGGTATETPWWRKEYEDLKYIEIATGVRYEHRVVKLVVFLMAALAISVIVWRGLCSWVGWLYWNNLIVLGSEANYDSYIVWKAQKLMLAVRTCQNIPVMMISGAVAMGCASLTGSVLVNASRRQRWIIIVATGRLCGWSCVLTSMVGLLVVGGMTDWMISVMVYGVSFLLVEICVLGGERC